MKRSPGEVLRVPYWEEGDFACVVCLKQFHLSYNGGELDEHYCCGHEYRQEHVRTDLVVRNSERE